MLKSRISGNREIVQSFKIERTASLIEFLCKHLLGTKSREEELLLKQHIFGDKEIMSIFGLEETSFWLDFCCRGCVVLSSADNFAVNVYFFQSCNIAQGCVSVLILTIDFSIVS